MDSSRHRRGQRRPAPLARIKKNHLPRTLNFNSYPHKKTSFQRTRFLSNPKDLYGISRQAVCFVLLRIDSMQGSRLDSIPSTTDYIHAYGVIFLSKFGMNFIANPRFAKQPSLASAVFCRAGACSRRSMQNFKSYPHIKSKACSPSRTRFFLFASFV